MRCRNTQTADFEDLWFCTQFDEFQSKSHEILIQVLMFDSYIVRQIEEDTNLPRRASFCSFCRISWTCGTWQMLNSSQFPVRWPRFLFCGDIQRLCPYISDTLCAVWFMLAVVTVQSWDHSEKVACDIVKPHLEESRASSVGKRYSVQCMSTSIWSKIQLTGLIRHATLSFHPS